MDQFYGLVTILVLTFFKLNFKIDNFLPFTFVFETQFKKKERKKKKNMFEEYNYG